MIRGGTMLRDPNKQVMEKAPVGVLDEDLRRACLEALELSRHDCRDFALYMSWEKSARIFVEHVAEATQVPRRKRTWLRRKLAA